MVVSIASSCRSRGIGGVHGLDHAILYVVLRATNLKHTLTIHGCQVVEIHIGLVKHHDFTSLKPRTQVASLGVFVELGGIHDDRLWEKALKIQVHMALGRRLSAPVSRPVHAIGRQLDRGRVHGVDRLVEPSQIAPAHLASGRRRVLLLQVFHHLSVQGLSHQRTPFPVGMTQRVLCWSRRPANRREHRLIHPQTVAHIVQTHRMSHLRVDQTDHMTPRRKLAAPVIDSVQLRQPFCQLRFCQMRRNQVAYLPQNCVRNPLD